MYAQQYTDKKGDVEVFEDTSNIRDILGKAMNFLPFSVSLTWKMKMNSYTVTIDKPYGRTSLANGKVSWISLMACQETLPPSPRDWSLKKMGTSFQGLQREMHKEGLMWKQSQRPKSSVSKSWIKSWSHSLQVLGMMLFIQQRAPEERTSMVMWYVNPQVLTSLVVLRETSLCPGNRSFGW